MSNINKGVLIFNEWFDAMDRLSPKDYKALMKAIHNAQINDVPPPVFTGKSAIVASMVFPCIERRKAQSRRGLISAALRLARQEKASADRSDDVDGTVDNSVYNAVGNQSKEKKNKAEYSYSKANAPAAKAGSSFDLDEFFAAAVRRSLGKASEKESDKENAEESA
jgi:hypothetical protein